MVQVHLTSGSYFLADDFIAGHLILSLGKDTYERLGILGKPSKFDRHRQRYRRLSQLSMLEILLTDICYPCKQSSLLTFESLLCGMGSLDMNA